MFYLLTRLQKTYQGEQSGAVAIEYAFVIPIFLLLVFSILEYGMMMYAQGLINTAASDASRVGITGTTQDSTILTTTTAKLNYIATIATNDLGPFAHLNGNSVTVTACDLTTTAQSACSGLTPATSNMGGAGDTIQYTIKYTWHTLSPLMAQFCKTGTTSGVCTMQSIMIVKNENF